MSVHAGLLINTLLTHPVCLSALACVHFALVQSAALHVVTSLHCRPPTGQLLTCVSVLLHVWLCLSSPCHLLRRFTVRMTFFFFTQTCSSGFSSLLHIVPKSHYKCKIWIHRMLEQRGAWTSLVLLIEEQQPNCGILSIKKPFLIFGPRWMSQYSLIFKSKLNFQSYLPFLILLYAFPTVYILHCCYCFILSSHQLLVCDLNTSRALTADAKFN